MERREFLSGISMSLALACAGCFAACSKSSSTPTTGGGGTGGTSEIPFSINLGSDLQTVGSTKVEHGVIVVRLDAANTASSFAAVAVACTHQGTSIEFNSGLGHFKCPNHGSEFSTDGSVLLGPATNALKHYNVAVSGSTLTIS